MAELKQYIDIMLDGLRKKAELLKCIMDSNSRLEKVIDHPEMNLEQFKALMEEKDQYVTQINQLDEGFQSVFEKVQEELHANKSLYSQQIQEMQQLIRTITDRAVQIQETEDKNRMVIEGQFARMRKNVRQVKKGVSVAQNYYKTMSNINVIDSQFLDKKK